MPDLFISRQRADEDILMAAAFMGERIRSAEGHADAIDKVVPQILAADDVDLAAELSNAIDDPFSRDRLLARVAVRCSELGDDEYALQLIEAIEDVGMRSIAIERCSLAKVAAGQLDAAIELSDAIAHPDNVYAAVAVAHYNEGRKAESDTVLDEIDFPTARVSAMLRMANAELEKEGFATAAELLTSAREHADEIEHDEERIAAMVEIGTGFIAAKRNDLAITTFADARDIATKIGVGHRDLFLSNCAIGFRTAGSVELAEETIEMLGDKTHIAATLLGFARESWRADDKETAVEDLDEAFEILKDQHERETRDSKTRNALMASIAAQFAGFGKAEKAIEVAEANDSDEQKVAALTQIAKVLDVKKETATADEATALIAEPSERTTALVSRAENLTENDDTASAIEMLERAENEAASIEQITALAESHLRIADRAVTAGSSPLASRNISSGLLAIAGILDPTTRASLIADIATIVKRGSLELTDADREVVYELIGRSEN